MIPGKTQLISRRASSFAHPVSPIYADHAKGSRFVDVDGNEYIDWVNAVTAIILGHADDVVDDAVRDQIGKGSLFTLNSPLEIELAELLINTIPSVEMVCYTKADGSLTPSQIVTHRLPYARMQEAYEMAYHREKTMLGVIFQWQE